MKFLALATVAFLISFLSFGNHLAWQARPSTVLSFRLRRREHFVVISKRLSSKTAAGFAKVSILKETLRVQNPSSLISLAWLAAPVEYFSRSLAYLFNPTSASYSTLLDPPPTPPPIA